MILSIEITVERDNVPLRVTDEDLVWAIRDHVATELEGIVATVQVQDHDGDDHDIEFEYSNVWVDDSELNLT